MLQAYRGVVDVWEIHIPHFHPMEKELFELLDDREKARAVRFVFPHLTTRYIIGHAALRIVLGRYTGVKPQDVTFRYGEKGKPYLADNPYQIEFNYSDSHEKALIGISAVEELGVDIEIINPKILEKNLHESVFSKKELAFFLEHPNQVQAFYCGWTHKEAMLKLLGTGLYVDMTAVEVPLELATNTLLVHYGEKTQYVRSYILNNEYHVAVASNTLITDIRTEIFNV